MKLFTLLTLALTVLCHTAWGEDGYRAPKLKYKSPTKIKTKVKKESIDEAYEYQFKETEERQRSLASDEETTNKKVEYQEPRKATPKKHFTKPRHWRYDR